MKYAKVLSMQQFGINSAPVELECRQSTHLPSFQLIGGSATQARMIRERVFSALESVGYRLPARKITLHVLPEVIREGSQALDLPIALALLASEGMIPAKRLEKVAVLGGLRLDGTILSVEESLGLPKFLQEKHFRSAIVPFSNSHVLRAEHLDAGGGFHSLREVVDFLQRNIGRGKRKEKTTQVCADGNPIRLEQIKGHAVAKRMLLLSAAGGHHTLLFGPRGAGKSFIAGALPGILPHPSVEEREEIELIHTLGGESWNGRRPFRAPHASISRTSLIGGLGKQKFGEMSYAHGGVLFLDEVLEMDRHVLESLRVPMEEGELRIRRGDIHYRLPCRTTLVAAANLCPCGLLGDPRHVCLCTRGEERSYRRRLSAALLDRLDLFLTLLPEAEEDSTSVTTAEYQDLAACARARMIKRQGRANVFLRSDEVFTQLAWSPAAIALWEESCRVRGLSYRAGVSLARVALTIADLREAGQVSDQDLLEALHYRLPNA